MHLIQLSAFFAGLCGSGFIVFVVRIQGQEKEENEEKYIFREILLFIFINERQEIVQSTGTNIFAKEYL
jgi:hypothetical protein